MPLNNYGVWAAYPINYVAEKDDSTPHLQLYFDEDPNATKGRFRAAINIKSSTVNESRLVYWFVKDISHPITAELVSFKPGWHPLNNKRLPALDYIRSNVIDLKNGTLLRHNVPGENNDIIDFVSPVLDQAIKRKAVIYLFGEQFPNGIHDVHMNQGNTGSFARYNGVWQDGGILLHFPDDDHWEGIFLAFGVQKVHTDDTTGNPISDTDFVQLLEQRGGGEEEPEVPDGKVYIRAALLNPVGNDSTVAGERETVHLLNRTLITIDLAGWNLTNRNGDVQALSGSLAPGATGKFLVPDCPLSNRGGTITLLDAEGLKVDGVSYSKEQARREGDLVWFH